MGDCMKKYISRSLSVLLAVVLLLCATGCNLTTTTVTSEIRETVSYVDGNVVTKPEDNTTSGSSKPSDGSNTDNSGVSQPGNTDNPSVSQPIGSGDTPQDAGDVDASKEKKLSGKLELQIFVGGYGSAAWEYAIAEFEKLNPDLKITAHLDSNVNAQMSTRWAKDNPPDFVFLEGTNIPKDVWMSEGKLMDLSSLYSEGKVYGTDTLIKNQIKSGLTTNYKNTSKIYEMPVLLSTYGMWYDNALFSAKGWNVPKNYDELKSFCSTSKTAGYNPLIYTGQYSGYLVWGLLIPAVAAEAVQSNDLDFFYRVLNASDEAVFADARFKRCIAKLKELADAGYFNQESLSANHITSQQAWLAHEGLLIPNGLWLENEMADSTPENFKMRYCPAVLQDAGQPTCVVASSATVGIASKAKNPEAAKAFLRFLYTDDVATKFAELCAVPSASRTDVSSAKLTAAAKQVNDMINSPNVTLIAKGSTSWGSVDGAFNNCVNKIVAGDWDVDKVVSELQAATKKKNS